MNSRSAAQCQAGAQQFTDDQVVRQHMHEQFVSGMERGTDFSIQHAADVEDCAMNRQTIRDPAKGRIGKVASANGYTRVDSTGHDVSANRITLYGTGKRPQVMHPDGRVQ